MKRRIIAKHLTGPKSPLGVWLLSDVSYSDECRTKKFFQYAENMFPLFVAILEKILIRVRPTENSGFYCRMKRNMSLYFCFRQ